MSQQKQELNGKFTLMLTIMFTILTGLGGWNLHKTTTISEDVAAMKQQVLDYVTWGAGENDKNIRKFENIDEEINELNDKCLDTRFWVEENFERKK